jgi:glycerol kinase
LAIGFWDGPDEVRTKRKDDVRFEPRMDASEREERRARWQRAVERSRNWTA